MKECSLSANFIVPPVVATSVLFITNTSIIVPQRYRVGRDLLQVRRPSARTLERLRAAAVPSLALLPATEQQHDWSFSETRRGRYYPTAVEAVTMMAAAQPEMMIARCSTLLQQLQRSEDGTSAGAAAAAAAVAAADCWSWPAAAGQQQGSVMRAAGVMIDRVQQQTKGALEHAADRHGQTGTHGQTGRTRQSLMLSCSPIVDRRLGKDRAPIRAAGGRARTCQRAAQGGGDSAGTAAPARPSRSDGRSSSSSRREHCRRRTDSC